MSYKDNNNRIVIAIQQRIVKIGATSFLWTKQFQREKAMPGELPRLKYTRFQVKMRFSRCKCNFRQTFRKDN